AKNLRLAIDKFYQGKPSRLAEAVGKHSSQITRIFSHSEKDKRKLGDKFAREIEVKIALPRGWLDRDNQLNLESNKQDAILIKKIPLIGWADVTNWLAQNNPINNSNTNWLHTFYDLSPNAFALNIENDAMGEAFPLNTKIIIEQSILPRNRSFVLAQTDEGAIPIFRQFLVDGSLNYLIALNRDYPKIEFKRSTKIIGVFVGADYTKSFLKL
ncbi:MAG: S24 family peptidase, partial [Pseudomonadota bacterium]